MSVTSYTPSFELSIAFMISISFLQDLPHACHGKSRMLSFTLCCCVNAMPKTTEGRHSLFWFIIPEEGRHGSRPKEQEAGWSHFIWTQESEWTVNRIVRAGHKASTPVLGTTFLQQGSAFWRFHSLSYQCPPNTRVYGRHFSLTNPP